VSRRHKPQKWSPQANTRENIKNRICYTFNITDGLETLKNSNTLNL